MKKVVLYMPDGSEHSYEPTSTPRMEGGSIKFIYSAGIQRFEIETSLPYLYERDLPHSRESEDDFGRF